MQGSGSPNKTNQGKNWDHGHSTKGTSAQKISPTKQQATASKYNDNSHYNNGQVMTQISAIYAKRSRSILNQFGQTNIGAHVHVNHVGHGNHGVHGSNNNHLSPNQNINQGRGSVGNTDSHDHHNNASKGSPRLGRLRGISPQSREKNYASNSGNATNSAANNSSFPSS